jgi:hypothetical protein
MKRRKIESMGSSIAVFLEKQSGAWFYVFSRNWSTYRSNQGYDTKELAEKAGIKHWQSLD